MCGIFALLNNKTCFNKELINSLKAKIYNSSPQLNIPNIFSAFNQKDGYDYQKLLGTSKDIENLSFWVLCNYAASDNHNLKPICKRLDVLYDVQTIDERIRTFLESVDLKSASNWSSIMLEFLKTIDKRFELLEIGRAHV